MRAGDIPAVGLINDDCVPGLQDGIEAGLTGVCYKNQIDVFLMRRLESARQVAKRVSITGACICARVPEGQNVTTAHAVLTTQGLADFNAPSPARSFRPWAEPWL